MAIPVICPDSLPYPPEVHCLARWSSGTLIGMNASKPFALFLALLLFAGCGGVTNVSMNSGGAGSEGGTGGSDGTGTTSQACSAIATGAGGSLGGFVPFPANNPWNQDVSAAPVDPNSANIINTVGSNVAVHADFGSGLYNGSKIGIPYVVVDGTAPQVIPTYTSYGDESDPGPMPIPASAPIEGDPNPGDGDRHVLVLDKGNCFLYELAGGYANNGGWSANVGVIWDMTANEQRPLTWTSVDAAGLAIFPGLARYDEVSAGKISHALRFTLQQSQRAFVAPASHWASSNTSSNVAPMGARFRLKSSFDITNYSAANRVILRALKQYGMIMADNGSSMYISGAPDDRWDNNDLHQLGNLHASDFEVVQMGTVITPSNLPQGNAPGIVSFTSSSLTTTPTGAVTLNWNISGASYVIISPQAGPVRGNSVDVKPGATTTYTLYATNQFGRTTATLTVNVQ